MERKRTTIRLGQHLVVEIKKIAAESGRTFTAVVEDSLRETVARHRRRKRARRPLKLTTYKGRGLQPGVDLDDSAALLDRMEGS